LKNRACFRHDLDFHKCGVLVHIVHTLLLSVLSPIVIV